MRSTKPIEQLQAEADYYHDRVALLRAKLYRWGASVPTRARNRSNASLSAFSGACATRGCARSRDATC